MLEVHCAAFWPVWVPAMKTGPEEGIIELCPDDRKRAIPADAARLTRMIEQAYPGSFEDDHREVLEASLVLSFETACIVEMVLQHRRGVLSRWQTELLLQSLLLIVGVHTTTSVWNLLTDQVSEVLHGSSTWRPREYARTSSAATDFVASVNALALTGTAEDACARVAEVWRDTCRCAADLMHLLLVSSGSASTDVRLPDA